MALHYRDTRRELTGEDGPARSAAQYSALQTYFIERLARLVRKAALLGRYLVPGDRRMRLLNHAILATYDDCRALGLTEEARAILATTRRVLATPSGETPR
jgi:hypothetical protein